jgi:hypothetical protein
MPAPPAAAAAAAAAHLNLIGLAAAAASWAAPVAQPPLLLPQVAASWRLELVLHLPCPHHRPLHLPSVADDPVQADGALCWLRPVQHAQVAAAVWCQQRQARQLGQHLQHKQWQKLLVLSQKVWMYQNCTDACKHAMEDNCFSLIILSVCP